MAQLISVNDFTTGESRKIKQSGLFAFNNRILKTPENCFSLS